MKVLKTHTGKDAQNAFDALKAALLVHDKKEYYKLMRKFKKSSGVVKSISLGLIECK